MTEKCFYCGRPYKVDTNDEGETRIRCAYPRCRLNPVTDWHKDIIDCYSDLEMIRMSMRK